VAAAVVVVAVVVEGIGDRALRTANAASAASGEVEAAAVVVAAGVVVPDALNRNLRRSRATARVRSRTRCLPQNLQNVQLLQHLRRRQPPQSRGNPSGRR